VDAVKGFEPEDEYTAIPKVLIPKQPYASFVVPDAASRTSP